MIGSVNDLLPKLRQAITLTDASFIVDIYIV